jgi:lipoate-protein ligase A
MPKMWRLVDSGLVSPPESAALDDAMLEAHIAGVVPSTLHYYVRARPTVSVGYFQKISESVDSAEVSKRGVAIVRRKSGGSSIYTDTGQLIYGLVVHESELLSGMSESFRVICSAIARAVSSFGLDARYRPMNDVEVNGRKISGNAQLRRKGSVLQHGTVIIRTDLDAMDAVLRVDKSKNPSQSRPSERVANLTSLLGKAVSIDDVKERMTSEFSKTFEVHFENGDLSESERAIVDRLVAERYSRKEWNLKF